MKEDGKLNLSLLTKKHVEISEGFENKKVDSVMERMREKFQKMIA